MAESRVEQRVGQVKKYVEKNKGWRPERRTVGYLAVMLVALVLGAIFIPKILPGTVRNSEALLGRRGNVEIVPLGAGPARQFIPAPKASEGYSSWAISESREEVIVGWYHTSGGKVDKVSVQSKSAYSGRQQVEWPVEVNDNSSRVALLGFIPRHNQIWFLAGGRIRLIDIKSSQIIDFPFKGPEGKGEVKAPTRATYAAFSPLTGRLAYAEGAAVTIVTGLASSRNAESIEARVVLVPNKTRDSQGHLIEGKVLSFTWVGDDVLAVVMKQNTGGIEKTPIYFVSETEKSTRIELKVQAPPAGVFRGISHAPTGSDFAVLHSDLKAPSSASRRDSIYVYTATGKLSHKIGLPSGPWSPPLSWGP